LRQPERLHKHGNTKHPLVQATLYRIFDNLFDDGPELFSHYDLDQKQLKLSISGDRTYFFNASFGNVEKRQEEFEFDEGVESAEAVFD